MNKNKIKRNKGFVLLFVIILSSIILAITLDIMNISYKEIKFSTSAVDTNNAFFAADTGAECALFNDKSTINSFKTGGSGVDCLGNNSIPLINSSDQIWSFTLSGLGSGGQGCAKVTVDKSGLVPNPCGNSSSTCISSKGYNDGGSTCTQTPNSVERQLELSY